mgnify:CR=1 FL=1
MCLALPSPRTGSSGAQGLWKVNLQPNHSQPRPKGVKTQGSLDRSALGPHIWAAVSF